jgi:hypothetical protein
VSQPTKRAKSEEKDALLQLIDTYNISQVASYNPASRTTLKQISKNGVVLLLRERLRKAGVAIPVDL